MRCRRPSRKRSSIASPRLSRASSTLSSPPRPLGTAPGGPSDVSPRHQMLAKVRRDWIDGYLKPSLDNLARLELELEENPNAVSRSWDVIVPQPDRAPRPLPPGQAMGDIFD